MDYQQISVSPAVFRAYDIRGRVDIDLDEHAYYSIGLAFACMLKQQGQSSVYLGRDGRLSSEPLSRALAAALLQSGMTVLNIGAVPTPMLYYATKCGDCDSGLMVTGSHNPADYNGIKMVLSGRTLVKEDIEQIYQAVLEKNRLFGHGMEISVDIVDRYQQEIISDIKLRRSLKVIVDCGNSIAGASLPLLLEKLGCDVIPLFCEVDGRFPNHHPDPSDEKNLIDLKSAVLKHQADIGLAFDGDADRLGVITEKAEVIWPDRLMMLFARHLLKNQPGSSFVFDVKCSSNLKKVIETAGGKAIMCPTGHSIVKAMMLKENAILAGEMSGHLFFKDRWYGFDDAMYSACRLLEILSERPLSVHQQFSEIPDSVNTPELKIEIADDLKFSLMKKFSEIAVFPEAIINRMDGLRVEFPAGWGLLRVSNTTPCLVARFEAETKEQLMYIQSQFKAQLLALDNDLSIPF
jgi:phosphomannomutase/phosphoglucomutase